MEMKPVSRRSRSSDLWLRWAFGAVCAAMLVPGGATLLAQQAPVAASPTAVAATPAAAPEQAAGLPAEQLESLVAPIALYPDPLLAQVLAASTYPLEIIQLQQWMAKNPGLKDQALVDAVAKQPWDPAVQSMAAFPDVVKRLADDIQWTTDLGNAVLAQQSDVMDAVQRMRKKAKDKGALESNEQQKVETQVVETKEVIVIQSASPEVIYVPSYSPTVVYGPPVYPYPPIYYPPYPPGAAFVSFSFGVMWGAAWGGSCCGCGWGGNDIDINVDNNFNRNTNINRGGDKTWNHNSQHRGGAPYADKATANKYGGTARGDSLSSRQASARQQQARGGTGASNRASTGASTANRAGSGAGRGTSPSASNRATTGASRGSSPSASSRSSGGYSRAPSASSASRGGGFGGSGGYSGSSARSSSSRGASSYGGRGGGGGRRR
jgi:hypothetical protein